MYFLTFMSCDTPSPYHGKVVTGGILKTVNVDTLDILTNANMGDTYYPKLVTDGITFKKLDDNGDVVVLDVLLLTNLLSIIV